MQEWINTILSADQTGIIVFVAVFLLGVISVFTCACNFAFLGSVAGYASSISATSRAKTLIICSIFFLIGVVVAMSVVGCIVGFAGGYFVEALGSYWKICAGIILIFFGVHILDILPFKIPAISSFNYQSKKAGIAGAMLLGITIGGFTALHNMCCNPIYPVVIATIFVKGNIVWGLLMLFFYSLGYGGLLAAAMLGAGLGTGKISLLLSKFAVAIKYVGGITLIILGFYFLMSV